MLAHWLAVEVDFPREKINGRTARKSKPETDFLEEVLNIFAARVSTELERHKMEVEQQSFFSLSLDLTCIVGIDEGRYKRLNPAFEKILGYSTAELMSKPALDFFHPEDKAAGQEAIAQLLAGIDIPVFESRHRCKDGSYRWFLWAATAVPEQRLIYATARDITERKDMERALRIKVKQQAAVASLGQVALSSDNLDELMNAAVVAVAQTLEIEYCKVLERLPDGKSLRLKAGVGWQSELVGTALIGIGQGSQAGYTLRTSKPVVVTDLRTEPRFCGTAFLRDRNIISGMSTIVQGQQKPYGTLCAHTTQLRSFSDEDVDFLQSVANLLAQAIEQKNAREIVIQSEHEYRTLAENLPGIVYRVFLGKQRHMVFLNDQCQTLTGFTSEELENGEVCSIDPLIVPEDRPQVIAAVQAGVARQVSFQVEYRIQDKAGNIRYFWEKGQPIAAKKGQPAYIDGVIFDVSDRKQAQQTIEEQAALLNVATDAILVYSLTGEILFWNKGAESIYGWSAEEALLQNVYRLLYPDDNKYEEDSLLKLAPTGSWQGELQQVTKQNQIIVVMSRWTLVKDKQGNPTSILSVDTDITEAKQLEAQFLRAQRLVSIGSWASGIAHDSTKQSTGGTGLGLSTVHSIVKNHGGFITVCSELGKGTQFEVYLPAIASADTSVEAPAAFPSGNERVVASLGDRVNAFLPKPYSAAILLQTVHGIIS